VLGGVAHTAAFHRARTAIETSNLPPFFGKSCKALWLADSTTMFILAVVFGLIAVRPSVATRPVAVLLALIPAAIGVLICTFLGGFFAGHILHCNRCSGSSRWSSVSRIKNIARGDLRSGHVLASPEKRLLLE
jgi:hypothetical protein